MVRSPDRPATRAGRSHRSRPGSCAAAQPPALASERRILQSRRVCHTLCKRQYVLSLLIPSPSHSQDNSADAQAICLATACSPYHTICREGWIVTVCGRRLQNGYKTPTLFGTFCTPCSRSILQAVTL